MESLNKAAGVQEPVPSSFPEPPPIPQSEQDIESQNNHTVSRRPSRSSLPVNRKPSRRTLNGQPSQSSLRNRNSLVQEDGYTVSRQSQESAIGEAEDDIAWGPQHPCFPHPNPHVPLDSPEYTVTRIIRVQRDWLVAGDLYPAYQNLYPEILMGYISEDEFRSIIEMTNRLLREAFDPWAASNWVDAILGVVTGFLWDNTGLTSAKRKVGHVEEWVDRWNREAARQGKEARLVGPRQTGFLSLDVQIPDPFIDEPVLIDNEPRLLEPPRL